MSLPVSDSPESPPPAAAPANSRPSAGGRAFLVAMGLIAAATGAVFTWGLWHAGERAMETRAWTAVPCRVIFSTVYQEKYSQNDPLKWRAVVEYTYTWEGKPMTGDRIRRVSGPTPHLERAEEKVKDYPVGKETQCWVDPADPSTAVLEHDSKAPFYTLWWPMLFVVGGLGISIAALRRGAGKSA